MTRQGPRVGQRLSASYASTRTRAIPRLMRMIFVRPASGGQLLFTGVLLCCLMLLWTRAAVIVYALLRLQKVIELRMRHGALA